MLIKRVENEQIMMFDASKLDNSSILQTQKCMSALYTTQEKVNFEDDTRENINGSILIRDYDEAKQQKDVINTAHKSPGRGGLNMTDF